MRNILKMLASKLPLRYQQEMKRLHFGRQIRKGIFRSDEPELNMLERWITNGDVVLDIGANVGHYTVRFSNLVGLNGRVIAFEPVPETFELLAANMAIFPVKNVTLLNVAVSETTSIIGMSIPKFDTGLNNYYCSKIDCDAEDLLVLCMSVDSLNISEQIKLAKIDVEGHELSVLKGMKQLVERDHPILIIEGDSDEIFSYLKGRGYSFEKLEGSPNRVYRYIE